MLADMYLHCSPGEKRHPCGPCCGVYIRGDLMERILVTVRSARFTVGGVSEECYQVNFYPVALTSHTCVNVLFILRLGCAYVHLFSGRNLQRFKSAFRVDLILRRYFFLSNYFFFFLRNSAYVPASLGAC